jgi:hypothetical protein
VTIQKRYKKRKLKRGDKFTPPVNPEDMKNLEVPVMDKMIHYPRVCPICRKPAYSSMCTCGRLTVLTKEV